MRPARDHGLTPAARLRSHSREPGLSSLVIAATWRGMTACYLRLFHGLRVDGLEHLPPAPFVMIANHTSHLDALTLASALPYSLARKAFSLAAGDTFFTSMPISAFAAHVINALPVWRGRTTAGDMNAIRTRLTEDGAVLIMFPEGTRSRDGSMARFRTGVGTLVSGTSVPVVPCYLDGAHAAWPAGRYLPRPRTMHLVIGRPLDFSGSGQGRAELVAVSAACEQAVRDLAPTPTVPVSPVQPCFVSDNDVEPGDKL